MWFLCGDMLDVQADGGDGIALQSGAKCGEVRVAGRVSEGDFVDVRMDDPVVVFEEPLDQGTR